MFAYISCFMGFLSSSSHDGKKKVGGAHSGGEQVLWRQMAQSTPCICLQSWEWNVGRCCYLAEILVAILGHLEDFIFRDSNIFSMVISFLI